MKKSDLKQLIKPLVKECVNEVLLEEGLLSNIVEEVAKGVSNAAPLVEKRKPPTKKTIQSFQKEISHQRATEVKSKINEHQKKLLDAIGSDAYNGVDLFEGTSPMSDTGARGMAESSVLGDPTDSGVPLSGPLASAARLWDKLI
jgi:hypothetical protein|tara:strand:+ start:4697 stop:5128 length:432 start_codon:yes stop_codon:yes gene_type:complete